MKNLISLFCILVTGNVSLWAQTPSPSLEMIAAPSSPTAASLSRYVDFPVTMSSGIPGISIPLYEFKSSRITVPISLSYHAGGIRVTDRTSTIGLGWSLIAGGAITRSIVGLPDEMPRGFLKWAYPDDLSDDFEGMYYQHHSDNRDLSEISCFVNKVNNTAGNNGYNYDHSPDNYYYNAQGLSGQFSYGTDGVLRTIPYDPIRIKDNIRISPNGEVPFIIKATDGVVYEFGGVFETGKSTAADHIAVAGSPEYASAWYLTRIISADKSDTIFFRYSTVRDYYLNTGITSTMRSGFYAHGSFPFLNRQPADVSKSQSSSAEYNIRLEEIKGKNGRVVFNYGEETVYSYRWGSTLDEFPSTIRPISSIEIYANHATEVKIKQFNFQHSFFNSIPTRAPNSLRLDSVTEVGVSSAGNQSHPPHVFTYASDDVPPFNTNSRDLWGQYNGYISYGDNDNMLLVDLPVPFGDENGNKPPKDNFKKRAVNPDLVKMGMLKSVSYPTGGYSEFTFEPNGKSKLVSVSVPQRKNEMIRTMDFWPGSGTGGIDKTFTLSSTATSRKLEFYGRLITYGTVYLENDPQVILEDVTTSEVIIDKTLSSLVTNAKTSDTYSVTLTDLDPMHTYRLYFPMPANDILPNQTLRYELHAFFNEELPPVLSTEEQFIFAGGLRVKSIEHRDNFTSGFVKKNYNYVESYWNSDAFNGDFNSIKEAFGKQLYSPAVLGYGSGYNTVVNSAPTTYIHQESPTYSIGSPSSSVSYSRVEEVQVTDDDRFIGKTEFTFNTGIDMVTTGIANGINWKEHVKIDRSFLRSQLLNKKIYKSEGNGWVLIQETENTYNNINNLPFDEKGTEYLKRYVTAYLYDDAQHAQRAGQNPYPISSIGADSLCNDYWAATPISFNTMYLNVVKPTLTETVINELGTSGNWIVNRTNYEYPNLSHMKPGEITTIKSDGSTVRQQIRYSTDIDIPYEGLGNSGWGSTTPTVIAANHPVFSGIINLQLANITTPVETTTFIKKEGSITESLLNSSFNYHNPLLPVIDSIAFIELETPVEQFAGSNLFDEEINYETDDLVIDLKYRTRVGFKYNNKGSVVQQQKTDNVPETFLWGYNEQYPLAHIVGAEYDVAKNVVNNLFLTHTRSYSESAIRTELNKLRTDNSTKESFSRTFTFAPFIGMTTETDPAGKSSYYEYDPHGRLNLVRDQFSHIIKKYNYNYSGDRQTYTYANVSQSAAYTKNDCPSGYWGTSVIYKVPGGVYFSTISQADANQKAAAAVIASGQAYANANGSCTAVPPPSVFTNKSLSMAFEKDDCPEGMAVVEDPVVYTVDAGQYSSTVSQLDADNMALDDLYENGQANANATCSCSSDPITIELTSGTDVDATLIIMDLDEEELEEIYFPANSLADPETIELPPTQNGYLLKFVVPLEWPYTDPYSNGPYRFRLQSEGLIWRSNYYNGRSSTTIWTQTEVLKLRPGRTYTITADKTWN